MSAQQSDRITFRTNTAMKIRKIKQAKSDLVSMKLRLKMVQFGPRKFLSLYEIDKQ